MAPIRSALSSWHFASRKVEPVGLPAAAMRRRDDLPISRKALVGRARGEKIVGIVTRANVLQAVATLGRHVPDPTADDDHIRDRIFRAMVKQEWCPLGLNVIVRGGIVHLSGLLIDEQGRQAAIVAAENVEGVLKVHDHLRWLEPISGLSIASPEDEEYAGASLPAQPAPHALPFH